MDLIDREQLMNYIRSRKINIGKLAHDVVMKQPNIQMQEPKTGHWIEVIDEIDSLGNKTWHHKCSICGNEKSGWGEYKYCPDCGYRMVDSQESEESK